MLKLLWLIPAFPLAGFFVLALAGPRLSRAKVALVGVGSVGLSAIMAALLGLRFIHSAPSGHVTSQILWSWIAIGNFTPEIGLYLDALSLVMVLVVTWVSFLIHLYSAEFMTAEEGYSRFFAYMNLFVGSMLTLVLADNLLLLYLGWEGVGLCSYLLIGFWYTDPANGRAAIKAFVVTRIGDTAMAICLFMISAHLGTLKIQELMQRASDQWPIGSTLAVTAAALLLGGAVGKSAQLPLQIWLPDAMAGPTPVSALIHAATMVTAGVYLIARTHVLFTLAPAVQFFVALIGAMTLLLAGFSALTQSDIKRVLAYSTISQIGYMFLALGVGAWSAAILHLMTHAFFKALLFLGAGVVIMSLRREHDMFKMGGLRRQLPLTFWTFLIASASLSALPLVTAGYYSKDLILWQAWSSKAGGPWLWGAALAGALLTSIYAFRMVFLTFFGEPKVKVSQRPNACIQIPLVILALLSVVGGLVELPETLGNRPLFSDFLHFALPMPSARAGAAPQFLLLQIIAAIACLGGIWVAYLFFLRHRDYTEKLVRTSLGMALHCFWLGGWSFDWVYDRLLVQPFLWLARVDKGDFVDLFYGGVARLSQILHLVLSETQTGRVRWYAAAIGLGAIVTIGIVVLL